MKKINSFIKFMLLIGIFFFSLPAVSIEQSTPSIEFDGKIKKTPPANGVLKVTLADLNKLKKLSIKTSTNWTNSETFTGVLLSDLLDMVGAKGTELQVFCLDDYAHTLPISEIKRYGVILATDRNGHRMTTRNLGPFAIIYPRDKYPKALGGAEIDAKFMWQVSKITVK